MNPAKLLASLPRPCTAMLGEKQMERLRIVYSKFIPKGNGVFILNGITIIPVKLQYYCGYSKDYIVLENNSEDTTL